MGRYEFSKYDSETIYSYYMNLSLDKLILEYDAFLKCSDIVFDEKSEVYNSFLGEFIDLHLDVLQSVFVERFISFYKKGFLVEF